LSNTVLSVKQKTEKDMSSIGHWMPLYYLISTMTYPLSTCWKMTSLPRVVTAATCNFWTTKHHILHIAKNTKHNMASS